MRRFRSWSFRWAEDAEPRVRRDLTYRGPEDAFSDRRGTPLRRTPHRITFETSLPNGSVVFRKLRTTRPEDARNEWRWLHGLAELGVPAPVPLFLAELGPRSAVGFLAVRGRSVLELLGEAGTCPTDFEAFLSRRVRPVVRRLHRAGLVHRDLYWNHLFSEDLDPEGPWVSLIDVERVRRIGWPRRRRWIVKDLAGLCSSWPLADSAAAVRRVLPAFAPADYELRPLFRDVLRKAGRIRAHVPKWDGSPGALDAPWP